MGLHGKTNLKIGESIRRTVDSRWRIQKNRVLGHRRRRRSIRLWYVRSVSRRLQGVSEARNLRLPAVEPVGAPDAVESPAETLQDFLSQSVAFSCPQCTMICGTVAFDRQKVLSQIFRIANAKIDAKAC